MPNPFGVAPPKQPPDPLSGLEETIYELTMMAHIAADIALDVLDRPVSEKEEMATYRIRKHKRDAVLFTVCDVEKRSLEIQEAFLKARFGGDSK